MGLAVLDADVLIGLLAPEDAHHERAAERMRASLTGDAQRRLCTVTLSEFLVRPVRAGRADHAERMLRRFGITVVAADAALARSAAGVRVRTGLRLPDAYVLATALQAQAQGHEGVRVETFDTALARASSELLSTA